MMDHLKQRIDTLIELVSTLVASLGQNAAKVALPSIWGSFLQMRRVGRLCLPKRIGTPRLARPELIPAYVEGALGTDVETLPKWHVRIMNPPLSLARLSVLGA